MGELNDFISAHHNPIVAGKNREIEALTTELAEARAKIVELDQLCIKEGADVWKTAALVAAETVRVERLELAEARAALAAANESRRRLVAEVKAWRGWGGSAGTTSHDEASAAVNAHNDLENPQ